jgi:hypothetical protein
LGLEGLGGLCEEEARIGYLGGRKITASCIILLDRMYRCKKAPWWYFLAWGLGWGFEGQIYPMCLAEENYAQFRFVDMFLWTTHPKVVYKTHQIADP